MDPADLRLDGNAAAGLLMEIFGREMTADTTVCATCLARHQVGELHVYAHGMGTVVRCAGCGGVQMKIAIIGGTYAVDLRGVHTLRLRPA
jgi:hypothetical protein